MSGLRIQINHGGLRNLANGLTSFTGTGRNSPSQQLINGLQNVVTRTNNMNGGVRTLGSAVDFIRNRVRMEERRRTAIQTIQTRTNNFIDTARDADARVARMVNSSTESFFRVNPWLRPPTRLQNFTRDVGRFFSNVGDTISRAWNGIVNFVKEHWQTILVVVAIIALVLVAVLTLGKALPALIAVFSAISKKAGAVAIAKSLLALSSAIGKTIGGKIAKVVGMGDLITWIGNLAGVWEEKSALDFARRIAPNCTVLNTVINGANTTFNIINLLSLPGSIADFAGSLSNSYSAARGFRFAPRFAGHALWQSVPPTIRDGLKFFKEGVGVSNFFRNMELPSRPKPSNNFDMIRNFRPLPRLPIIPIRL